LERHVQEVNALLKPLTALDSSEEEDPHSNPKEDWSGLSDPEPEPVDHEAEYIDEDKYTTVTVEAMDVSREGLFKAEQDDSEEKAQSKEAEDSKQQDPSPEEKKRRPWAKDKPKDGTDKPRRKKKRNFRYENKTERKMSRSKQKARNHKQARERKSE